jgi:DNA-binding XRE family transcriptional regulator
MILSHPNRVAQRRRDRGWTQVGLAEQSGVSRTEVSAIENGRLAPSVAVALRLAEALGESVEAVFGRGHAAAVVWAWEPAEPPARRWVATVDGRVLAYPVEVTAAGSIPHDRPAATSAFARPDRTLVIAGCDPLVGLLASAMAAQHGIRLLPLLRSSGDALELLRRGLVHVAGIHLTDAAGRSTNDASVRARLGTGYRLLHQVRWDSGIAVAGDRTEKTASALLRANVRWVNREEGSAARGALELLIASRR